MARKRRTSPAEGFIALAAMLPWWLAVIFAVASYLALHPFAEAPVTVQSVVPGQISGVVAASAGRALAQVAQYALPAMFLMGAGVSFFRARKSANLVAAATGNSGAQAISGMSWREFEILIAAGFRRHGFTVMDKGGQGPDGGVDLVLTKGKEQFLVQCKQWRALKVSVNVVRELYGVMSAEGVAGGIVVTSGAFTEDAKEFAKGRNIKLVDGSSLRQLLEAGKQAADLSPKSPRSAVSESTLPPCPRCGSEMKVRKAKTGPSAGKSFLGCSSFPACRGTLPL